LTEQDLESTYYLWEPTFLLLAANEPKFHSPNKNSGSPSAAITRLNLYTLMSHKRFVHLCWTRVDREHPSSLASFLEWKNMMDMIRAWPFDN
jgi:hypothetical protein